MQRSTKFVAVTVATLAVAAASAAINQRTS